LASCLTLTLVSWTTKGRHYQLALKAGVYGVCLSLSLVGGFMLFESCIETLQTRLPSRMRPIIRSMLIEMAGIGFIGLVLEALHVESGSGWVARLSQRQFEDPHLLVFLFERLHMSFFYVALLYFFTCALVIFLVERRFRFWGTRCRREVLTETLLATGSARGTWDRHVVALADRVRDRGFNPLKEVFKGYTDWHDEYLTVRHRFVQVARDDGVPMPYHFSLWPYMEEVAAENLKQLVKINPTQLAVFWLPPVSVGTAILIHVLDPNTNIAMAGALYRVSWYFWPLFVVNVAMLLWGCCNVLKLAWIKWMVMPVRRASQGDKLEPRYEVYPEPLSWVERKTSALLRRSPRLRRLFPMSAARLPQEELFGIPGANGRTFYLESTKWLTYFAVSSIVFCSEIVINNLCLIFRQGLGSVPVGTVPEAVLLGLVVMMNALTVALTPHAFNLHCWATSFEGLRRDRALAKVLGWQRSKRFRTTLVSLATLTYNLELAARREGPPRSAAEMERQWAALLARGQEDFSLLDTLWDMSMLFSYQDLDDNGVLSVDEVENVAKLLGYEIPSSDPARLERFVQNMSAGQSDGVKFREFATAILFPPQSRGGDACWLATFAAAHAEGDVDADHIDRRVFEIFDLDRNGSIELEEFTSVLRQVGFETMGAEQLFRDMGGGPLRRISLREFSAYLRECLDGTAAEQKNQRELQEDSQFLPG